MKTVSIRRRLLTLLLGSLVLVWSAMLAYGYVELREEVDELADERMEQTARTLLLLDSGFLQERSTLDNATSAKRKHDDDNDALAFQIWNGAGRLLLQAEHAPTASYDPRNGHTTLEEQGRRWRSYALRDPDNGYQVRVFEAARQRSHLVNKLALRMAQLPLIALPVLALFIWISISRGLQPLKSLSAAIAARNADKLEPLDLERVPAEAQGVIDSLNNLLRRLADSIDRERSFTADAAHELRTPLAAIKVQAEVALAAEDVQQRRHAIEAVIAGVDRTTRLAQQLLLLARLDHADAATAQPADLGELVVASAARFAEAAARRNIEFDVAAEPAGSVRADPMALAVMIDNLIDNAVKYGREGGHVSVRVAPEPGRVMFRIQDDGPSVTLEQRARLTDRFYRVTGSGIEGSGLGLAIVDRIVKRYRGSMEIGSGLGDAGLGITIRLPT